MIVFPFVSHLIVFSASFELFIVAVKIIVAAMFMLRLSYFIVLYFPDPLNACNLYFYLQMCNFKI